MKNPDIAIMIKAFKKVFEQNTSNSVKGFHKEFMLEAKEREQGEIIMLSAIFKKMKAKPDTEQAEFLLERVLVWSEAN